MSALQRRVAERSCAIGKGGTIRLAGWTLACALAALCAGARAQAGAPENGPAAVSSPRDPVQDELERESERTSQWFGTQRARISYPHLASAGFGLLFAERSRAFDCRTQCELSGWFGSAEAGVGGAQLDFGPAYMIGELGDNAFFLSRRYLGYTVKASLLRTWGDTPRRPDREWFGGIEGEFTVVSLNLSLGLYRRIGESDAREPWLVSGGIGWGF